MAIVICGSMRFARRMIEVQSILERLGHIYLLPEGTEAYAEEMVARGSYGDQVGARRKIAHNLIRKHADLIKGADAILVINESRGALSGYIGGNTFLEMGFAHIFEKKIFLLYDVPEIDLFWEEIIAMQPRVLHGDFEKIA